MKLIERLNEDLKDAMRAGDQARKLAIRSVKTAVRNAEVEKM
ncbi:MAG: GatB/YqeY domain-containing protein, partial [Anaerolineae bacterium]|nr:GatB/YqeY domain-containing protein [Anaerolineae bacterium]